MKFLSKRIFLTILLTILLVTNIMDLETDVSTVAKLNVSDGAENLTSNELYALSACLMDAESKRVLYDKNATEKRAMASTTKIATLIVALELKRGDELVTFSKYAASMPDVQMNAATGETYRINDLLYAMMLESYNDVAVAIAEKLGEDLLVMEGKTILPAGERSIEESKMCVRRFVTCMNELAHALECFDTHFVTPNGLDDSDEGGNHESTAVDMAKITSYAIQNEEFNKIVGTKKYSFEEINNKRHISVYNKDAFLDQMDGAFGVKTGFTGAAGYCFVGALRRDGRVFVSVVLGCGWPGNKNYKWKDTKALMLYGINNYYMRTVIVPCEDYKDIKVVGGKETTVSTKYDAKLSLLLSEEDNVKVIYELKDEVHAPVYEDNEVGKIIVYINGLRYTEFPITVKMTVERVDYFWFLSKLIKIYFLLD